MSSFIIHGLFPSCLRLLVGNIVLVLSVLRWMDDRVSRWQEQGMLVAAKAVDEYKV